MKTFDDFVSAVGQRESGNRYDCVNKFGFLGRFQFGMARLTDLGICKRDSHGFVWVPPHTRETFLQDHALQDELFRKHVGLLAGAVKTHYGQDLGSVVNGVPVTLSGSVAVCHLLGLGGLADFLAGRNGHDALGTTAKDYMKLFAGYEVP